MFGFPVFCPQAPPSRSAAATKVTKKGIGLCGLQPSVATLTLRARISYTPLLIIRFPPSVRKPTVNHQSPIINHQSSIINHQSSIPNPQSPPPASPSPNAPPPRLSITNTLPARAVNCTRPGSRLAVPLSRFSTAIFNSTSLPVSIIVVVGETFAVWPYDVALVRKPQSLQSLLPPCRLSPFSSPRVANS